VEPTQIAFTSLLIAVLLCLAGFSTWRQWQTLQTLKAQTDLSAEDRLFVRRQVRRRLWCAGLMIVLAALLTLSFVLEPLANQLVAQGEAAHKRSGEPQPLDPEQQRFFHLWSSFWIVTLLVLLGIIVLAGLDLIAIRRYGQRHLRQIQADRRAMIEEQIARVRSQRNGHG
jgi:hypothetical protein